MCGVEADSDNACIYRRLRRAGHHASAKVARTCHQNQIDTALQILRAHVEVTQVQIVRLDGKLR